MVGASHIDLIVMEAVRRNELIYEKGNANQRIPG